jgi:hypothetical protein
VGSFIPAHMETEDASGTAESGMQVYAISCKAVQVDRGIKYSCPGVSRQFELSIKLRYLDYNPTR